jgi:hypothetical protein
MTATHKSLATVLGLNHINKVELQEWSDNYLESFDPLSRLHAKFWGTSMEEEERQW